MTGTAPNVVNSILLLELLVVNVQPLGREDDLHIQDRTVGVGVQGSPVSRAIGIVPNVIRSTLLLERFVGTALNLVHPGTKEEEGRMEVESLEIGTVLSVVTSILLHVHTVANVRLQ